MSELLSVSLSLSRDVVLEGRREVVPFLIEILGKQSLTPPITVILVVDTSYSMDGEKIFRAKLSMLKILELLRDKDYVGVYSFSGDFNRVLMPTQMIYRKDVERAIVSLKLGSGTNMYSVFKNLQREVEAIGEKLKTPIKLIFITDGRPTVGPKSADRILSEASKLSERGLSSLIVGVGEDYNEHLLLKLANTLNGVFEHINRPELLEKVVYEYIAFSREISAKSVKLTIRPAQGFNIAIYNKKCEVRRDSVLVNVGDINYGERITVVGDIETPPLTVGLARAGEVQVSCLNPHTNSVELSAPIAIQLRVSSREELRELSIDKGVLVKAQAVKIASQLERSLERGSSSELLRDLEEFVEVTMKIGSEELASKTMSIRERMAESGLSPDLSKELASIISRVLSGRIKERREARGEGSER